MNLLVNGKKVQQIMQGNGWRINIHLLVNKILANMPSFSFHFSKQDSHFFQNAKEKPGMKLRNANPPERRYLKGIQTLISVI